MAKDISELEPEGSTAFVKMLADDWSNGDE